MDTSTDSIDACTADAMRRRAQAKLNSLRTTEVYLRTMNTIKAAAGAAQFESRDNVYGTEAERGAFEEVCRLLREDGFVVDMKCQQRLSPPHLWVIKFSWENPAPGTKAAEAHAEATAAVARKLEKERLELERLENQVLPPILRDIEAASDRGEMSCTFKSCIDGPLVQMLKKRGFRVVVHEQSDDGFGMPRGPPTYTVVRWDLPKK